MLCLICSTALQACHSDEPSPQPSVAARTVLVYMAANNNLTGFDMADISEMTTAARSHSFGNSRLLVYHSPRNSEPTLMEVLPEGLDTLRIFEAGSAVSAGRMTEVINDVQQFAPANKYGMVLWSHGSGWLQDGIAESISGQQRSFGNEGGRTMNISTLAAVLEQAPVRFDYLYFDCCFMGSVETVYELRRCTDYIIGSATELPTTGMPYDVNVPLLLDGSRNALIQAATSTFNYYDALSGSSRTCTMSVVDTSVLDKLAEATAAIYSTAASVLPQGYRPQEFTDYTIRCYYYDFKDYVHALTDDSSLISNFDTTFDKCVLYSAETPFLWNNVSLDRHNGLSTYILGTQGDETTKNYSTLSWYTDVAGLLPR